MPKLDTPHPRRTFWRSARSRSRNARKPFSGSSCSNDPISCPSTNRIPWRPTATTSGAFSPPPAKHSNGISSHETVRPVPFAAQRHPSFGGNAAALHLPRSGTLHSRRSRALHLPRSGTLHCVVGRDERSRRRRIHIGGARRARVAAERKRGRQRVAFGQPQLPRDVGGGAGGGAGVVAPVDRGRGAGGARRVRVRVPHRAHEAGILPRRRHRPAGRRGLARHLRPLRRPPDRGAGRLPLRPGRGARVRGAGRHAALHVGPLGRRDARDDLRLRRELPGPPAPRLLDRLPLQRPRDRPERQVREVLRPRLAHRAGLRDLHEHRRRHPADHHQPHRLRPPPGPRHEDALRLRRAAGPGGDGLLRDGHLREDPPRAGGRGLPPRREPPPRRDRPRAPARRPRLPHRRPPRAPDRRLAHGRPRRIPLPAQGPLFLQPQERPGLPAAAHGRLPLERRGLLDGDGRDGGGVALRARPIRLRLALGRHGVRPRRRGRRHRPQDLRPLRLQRLADGLPGARRPRARRRRGRFVLHDGRGLVDAAPQDRRRHLVRPAAFDPALQRRLLHARAAGGPRGRGAAAARRLGRRHGARLRAGLRRREPRLRLRGRERPGLEPEALQGPRREGRLGPDGRLDVRGRHQRLRLRRLRRHRQRADADRGPAARRDLVEHGPQVPRHAGRPRDPHAPAGLLDPLAQGDRDAGNRPGLAAR